jgi:hypothetical protein
MTPAPQLSLIPTAGLWVILTPEEVMERTGWSRATFFRRRAELISRATASGSVEYLESALPAKPAPHQLALVAPAQTLPLFASLPPSLERIVLPDPADQAQAEKRLAALEPLLNFPDNPSRYVSLQVNGKPVTSLERMIEYTAAAHGQSPRTIKRWLAQYRSGGFAALADRIRADKGQSRWFNCHREAQIFAAYLYLVERMSVTFVCEQIEYETAMLGLDKADLPSRETVRVFLSQSISPAMRTLARDGQRVYRERMAPYVKRGYVDVFANQVWVGDHAIHDVEIQNDLDFEGVPFGTPGRLRMSAFVDYRSRKAWATWAWEGSSRSIAATMLRAMLEVGPPEGIYVDNGKDYKKVAKGAVHGSEVIDDAKAPEAWYENEYQRIERTGLLARLGIAVTHCLPRHPQSKHVERFFRTMHMRFDAVHSTYTSGSPFTRPEATELAMMRHRRLLKAGRVEESNHPLASRFILGCLSWIREYNATPQTGEGMDGRSPDEIFATDPNPNQKPVPNPETLALLLAEFARRGVRECAVQLNKHRYTPRPEDRLAWAAMHEANDGEVLVGYNPDDPEFAVALTLDGRFLAWLEAEPLIRFAPNDPKTQAQIAQSMATRRGLEKAAKTTLRTIEGAARSMGAKSAEEMLYGRLQLPTNTSAVITQRKRLRPNKEAVAPSTAADIANNFLEGLK